MQWYYSKNGTQLGPVAQGELITKLASGEVSPSDLVWKDGMGDWIPASQVAELRSVGAAPSVPPLAAAEQVSTAPDSPYVSPVSNPVPQPYSPVPVAVPGSGKATASMVLGIVSVVTGLCGCYGLVIAVTCGILAIIFGGQVKKEAVLNPALAPELGKVKAGVIMGWIGMGISVLFTILMIAMGLASGAMQQMNP
jgi:hypothetical protein